MNTSGNTTENVFRPAINTNSFKISWNKLLVAFLLYALTLFTIIGNVLVLLAVKVDKKLRTTFNYYIVNLAITDVAVAVTAMSFKATHTVTGYWPFGEALCAVWIFFDYGMTFVSVFTLILISLDRFWCVTWSVHYRQHHTKRKCLISILGVWLFMLILWIPPWITDRVRYSEPGDCYWNPSLNKEFVFIVAILGHHGPFCIMLFCYTHVFVFMRKRSKIAPDPSGIDIELSNSNQNTSPRSDSDGEMPAIPKARKVHVLNDEISSPHTSNVNLDTCVSTNFQPTINCLQVPGDGRNQFRNVKQTKKLNRLVSERRIFITLSYIIIGYAILWLPFHVVFDISITDPNMVPTPILEMVFWMTYANSTVNPLLYTFSSPEFRKAFKFILTRRCRI